MNKVKKCKVKTQLQKSLKMFAPSFSPSGSHTHLAQTTKFDAIMDNRFNKICWKHEFHKTRIRRGLYDKITKQIEYEPCPECIVEKEQKEKEEILKLEAESNRIAKETHELHLKKINSILRRKAKEIQLDEKAANAELAQKAEENRLTEEAANVKLAQKAEENRLAEEAARIIKEDEIAAALLKTENLYLQKEEIRISEENLLLKEAVQHITDHETTKMSKKFGTKFWNKISIIPRPQNIGPDAPFPSTDFYWYLYIPAFLIAAPFVATSIVIEDATNHIIVTQKARKVLLHRL